MSLAVLRAPVDFVRELLVDHHGEWGQLLHNVLLRQPRDDIVEMLGLLLDWGAPVNLYASDAKVAHIYRFAEIDFSGQALFLMGLSWGGGLYLWKSAAVICTIVIGLALPICVGLWELYADLKYPVMPKTYFLNRGFISLVTAMFTTSVTYGGWLSCTVSAGTTLGQGTGDVILRYGGNSCYLMTFAAVAMVGFIVSLASLTTETKSAGTALTILGNFGVGFIELSAMSLAPLFCKPKDIGLASGMLASIRASGCSIAVAVYETILTDRLPTTLPAVAAGYPESDVVTLAAAVKAGTWQKLPGHTQEITAAVSAAIPTAYGRAFKTVYLASLGFGGIAVISAVCTKDATKLLTDRVERHMYGKFVDKKQDVLPAKPVEEQ